MKNIFSVCAVIGAIAAIGSTGVAYASPGAHGPNGEHLDGPATSPASGLARLPDGSVRCV